MNHFPLRRLLASAVCLSLLLACPGPGSYAAAQSVARSASASPASGPTPAPVAGMGGPAFSIPALAPSALGLMPTLGSPASPTPATIAPAAAANLSASAMPLSAAARSNAPAANVSAAARETAAALNNAGPIATASPLSSSVLGRVLEDVLTGAPSLRSGADLSAPAAGDWGAFNESIQLARPAGDALARAAAVAADVPASRPEDPPSAPRPPKGPFWPRLLSSGLALAPGVLLGVPLLAGSAYLIGGLVAATSLALAAMPFMDEASPKILRATPGLLLAALGVASAGVSLSLSFGLGVAVAPALAWTGAFALVGGWGLARYGLGKSERRYGSYGSIETLSAFFGGLAALTGVALAASTPLGWMTTGLLWLSYPVSALLWFHLPGWVGMGLDASLTGFWLGALGLSRVLTAIHRDTVLLDRLSNFSRRHWTASKWNAVWLAVIWTPIMLAEAAMYALSGVGGLAVGAIAAPVNFLWGASAKLQPGSRLNVYFAEAARLVFDNVQNGKIKRFNPIEAKLIPFANSPRLLVSAAGSLGLRSLQLGWFVYALIAAPLLSIAGLLLAFGRLGSYDEKRHRPRYLRIDRDDSPSEKPNEPNEPEPGTPSKAPLAPKLIASGLALLPVIFFGLPILAGYSVVQIGLYFGFALPLAAMPFLGKAPYWAKSFAGHALIYNGAVLLFSGTAILVGLLALLGGWGFDRWAAKTEKDGGTFDEAELGTFFGALGASAAVGAAWVGIDGGWIGWGTLALAAATSPFLLMHLPRWVGRGAVAFIRAFPQSVSSFDDVLGFWHDDTSFRSNLKKHASYWLRKTYWNGVWLSAIWVPTGLILAAEFVVAVALGAVVGLLRATFAFAAAALAEAAPGSRAARFTKSLVDGWRDSSEGSVDLFDRLVAGLKPAMNESEAVTGRPTAKAAGAFLLARFVQLAWLAGALLMNLSGAALLIGVYRGIRAAFPPSKP